MINVVQAALYAKIKAISGITAFQYVPQVTVDYPYVTVDPMALDFDDYDSESGFNGILDVNVWADEKSSLGVADIQKQIYDAMHHQEASFTIVGYGITILQQEFTEILLDPDGITHHGVQRFRVVFEPLP